MISEIASIFVGIVLLIMVNNGGIKLGDFLDFPSLLLILVFTVPILLKNNLWKDFGKAFTLLKKKTECSMTQLKRSQLAIELMQRQLICAAVLVTFWEVIVVFHQLSTPEMIGPTFAVICLVGLYAVIFELLLMPVKAEINRRIINYMGEE